jgi:hypothetical protein
MATNPYTIEVSPMWAGTGLADKLRLAGFNVQEPTTAARRHGVAKAEGPSGALAAAPARSSHGARTAHHRVAVPQVQQAC